ncbi:hypothetical protein A3K64_03040 [Candidatus Micrarchaeota archaeon RBG_16_36_9]|nr:MAG: hypothetical protein A3K64_03040 [Candidatus Micrarchaeota archaeon RBG_16_36_9]
MVNYEESIKKPFTDFGKLVIGIILSIIPIVNWIAQGFIIESSGIGRSKPSKNMPEWKNVGDYLIKGLLSHVIIFIYLLPAILILSATVGYFIGSLISSLSGVLPSGFVSSLLTGRITGDEVNLLLSQNWMLILPALLRSLPLILIGLFLVLVGVYLSPMAVLNYLKNKRFSSAFDLNLVFHKSFTSQYFLAWIIAGMIMIVIRSALFFIPVIGSAIAYFISGLIAYSLFGQVFREIK